MQKLREEGLSLPGEAEDKCCWCIPLKIGVILVGIGMIASAVSIVIAGLGLLGTGATFIFGVLEIAAVAPMVLGSYFYIRWFMSMEDNDRKQGLFKACLLCVLSNIAYIIVGLVMSLTSEYMTFGGWFVSGLIPYAIVSVLYLYYAGAAKKYAAQA